MGSIMQAITSRPATAYIISHRARQFSCRMSDSQSIEPGFKTKNSFYFADCCFETRTFLLFLRRPFKLKIFMLEKAFSVGPTGRVQLHFR